MVLAASGCSRDASAYVETGESIPAAKGQREITVGKFVSNSTELVVSDPGYPKEFVLLHDLGVLLEGCEPGTWISEAVIKRYDPGDYEIIAELWTRHESVGMPTALIKHERSVGVDSGVAGIWGREGFHANNLAPQNLKSKHKEINEHIMRHPDELWAMWCQELVSTSKEGVAEMPHGVVSMAGFGDGGYELFYSKNQSGSIVAIGIIFSRK